MAFRVDYGTLRPAKRTIDGRMRVDATLTRSGVFVYRNNDGTERREYRPPAEVFKADSMRSFELQPVTYEHPTVKVEASNAKELSKGIVLEGIRRDGNHMVASMIIDDAELIRAIETGAMREVSCGYECEYDPTPGVSPEGERHDGVQSNIVGNHVAVVPAGRAGTARIKLDRGDAAELVSDADVNVLSSPGRGACVWISSTMLSLDALTSVVNAALKTASLSTSVVTKLDAATPGLPDVRVCGPCSASLTLISTSLSSVELYAQVKQALSENGDVAVHADAATVQSMSAIPPGIGNDTAPAAVTMESPVDELKKALAEVAEQTKRADTATAQAEANAKRADAADKQVVECKAQIAKLEGERDNEKSRADKAETERKDAVDGLDGRIAAQVELIARAGAVLGVDTKLGEKGKEQPLAKCDARTLMLAVVKKVDAVDVDKDSDGKPAHPMYVKARFDGACERATKGAKALSAVLETVEENRGDNSVVDAEEKARLQMMQDGRDAWKIKEVK